MDHNIIINATNLHSGGGVQVAVSFISELYLCYADFTEIPFNIYISTSVNRNLPSTINTAKFRSFAVFNTVGFKKPTEYKKYFSKPTDLVFTIFGPIYFNTNTKVNIVGFAQSWIAYPKNIAYKKINFLDAVKNKIKFKIQEFYFKKSDYLIVELEHVKDALIKIGFNRNKISIIYNSYSDIFNNITNWADVPIEKNNKFTLGYLGRGYPHKNLKILSIVNEILVEKYKIEVRFIFTLSQSEMKKHQFIKINNFESIGEIDINQCPMFYKKIDALIFPSLLESFSATPIEAMKMNTTVIASDLPFIRAICKDSAFYFDPLDPYSIADAIFNAYSNKDLANSKITDANKIIGALPTAKDRAISYLETISTILKNH